MKHPTFQDWINAHQDELLLYRGKRIAIHLTHGIVASGDTLAEVMIKIKNRPDKGVIVIHSVPK